MPSANPPDRELLRVLLFRALADSSRMKIIDVLASGPRRVSDIVEATGLSQPNVSNHLACLYDCGLADRRRRGREVHYALASGVTDLLDRAEMLAPRVGSAVRTAS